MSRKLLLIVLGLTVLLGGTGAAALYIGTDSLLGEPETKLVGGECFDVQTMVSKTPAKHLWLRKFIRMENADGPDRVRTALRIAGLLAKDNAVDLIHVSVLDAKGPQKRADMRARTIGAEVLIAMHPENLPDMKVPAEASYYEGPANDEGKYYGEKISLDFDEVRAMMTSMKAVQDKTNCIKPESAEDKAPKDEKAKKKDHGEKPASEHGEKPAAENSDEAKPAEHGEQPAESTSKEHGQQPAKEQSFMDSMLGMVGLGGTEEPAPETHDATAVKEGELQSPDANAIHESGTDGDKSAETHEAKPEEQPIAEQPAAVNEQEASAAEHGDQPAQEKSFVDSMLGMVGLGASEVPLAAEAKASATKADDAEQPAEQHDTVVPEKSAHEEKPAEVVPASVEPDLLPVEQSAEHEEPLEKPAH